jgi:hypothetical protein
LCCNLWCTLWNDPSVEQTVIWAVEIFGDAICTFCFDLKVFRSMHIIMLEAVLSQYRRVTLQGGNAIIQIKMVLGLCMYVDSYTSPGHQSLR